MSYLPTDSTTEIKGLGPSRAKALAEAKDIETVGDLLTFYPLKHTDRRSMMPINELTEEIDYEVAVKGQIKDIQTVAGDTQRLEVYVTDGTGTIKGVWFRGLGVEYPLSKLKEVIFVGKPSRYGKYFSMAHPDFFDATASHDSSLDVGRIVPVYPSSEIMTSAGLSEKVMRQVMWNMLQEGVITQHVVPSYITTKRNMPSQSVAQHQIHFPDNWDTYKNALQRLQWEELFPMQYAHAITAKERPSRTPMKPLRTDGLYNQFVADLPFTMTTAQSVALNEIVSDMRTPQLMNRLLQGDVGAGKTVVAVAALLYAVDNGSQGVLMAPTSVLAEQHYRDLKEDLAAYDVEIALLTGNQTATEQDNIRQRLKEGQIDIAIGTHALIEGGTEFNDIGLAVIDEQHRFGVEQRNRLTKEHLAHVLLMTATPIPRSLTLVQYGDTESSVLDEMPPGRKDVKTYWHIEAEQEATEGFIQDALDHSEQVYVVCPLVEESEESDLHDAESYVEELRARFPDARIALVHGQLPSSEKDDVMRDFADHKFDILVSTTVIEVGVNVPNATVMVIKDANQFGLSQLHQLRGRVGRSDVQSYCILVTEGETEEHVTDNAYERLMTMTETNDGFEISEVDLMLRGSGDVAGTAQSGTGFFKLVDLQDDPVVLRKSLRDAKEVVHENLEVPDLLIEQAKTFTQDRNKFGVS